jgi:hypothetical protein
MKSSSTSVIARVATDHLKQTSIISLWYVGIYALVGSLLRLILSLAAGAGTEAALFGLFESFQASNLVFFYVLGIIFPLILEHFVALGVTRSQYFWGTLLMAAVLAAGFAVLTGIIGFATGAASVLTGLVSFASLVLVFLLGDVTLIGFLTGRRTVLRGTLSIVITTLLGSGLVTLLLLENVPPLALLGILLVVCAGLALVLQQLTKRLPLKC